jgi:hypothetical protein
MKPYVRLLATAGAVFALSAPLAAQGTHTVILRLSGGGADHLTDLSKVGTGASFSPGYNLGASAGLELTPTFAVLADFTFTRNEAWGTATFAGQDVNRFYYGVRAEARHSLGRGVAPYGFLGVGAVSVDQQGVDQFKPFTKPALMYGGGVSYALPNSRLGAFGELKGVTYRWNAAGFAKTMLDVTYSLGVSYKLDLKF